MRGLSIVILLCACADGAVEPNAISSDAAVEADGAAGDCVGSIERCDGVDDDCDGEVDEGLTRACGEALPGCAQRVQRCVVGVWGDCAGAASAQESCNGTDDDCDGAVDEGLTRACGAAAGACEPGIERCAEGAWVDCDATGGDEEVCEGLADEDCDGTVDEGCACADDDARPCGADVGRCSAGVQRCDAGRWAACSGATPPVPETCDDTDEDCDGIVDEGLRRPCGSAVGTCTLGEQICAAGRWGVCAGAVAPGPETCDGVDQDCDGVADEGLVRGCGMAMGLCGGGEQRCRDGQWGPCAGGGVPDTERCDGAEDEDCDGTIDEDCDCAVGESRPCGLAVGRCETGEESCVDGRWGRCLGSVGPGQEICEGALDEDCDGETDEGCDCVEGETRDCGLDEGRCQPGTETCVSGRYGPCEAPIGPDREVCDGAEDEDCDGQTDEGCDCTDGATRNCGPDQGACAPGTETCADGRWGACEGAVGPAAEVCDGTDDEDCDGTIDEGFGVEVQGATAAQLRAQHPDCLAAFGDHCSSAIHRLCRDTCHDTGYGPFETVGAELRFACVQAARTPSIPFAELTARHPQCTPDAPVSGHCNAAIDTYCRDQGWATGFGPVEHGNGGAEVACLERARIEPVMTTYAELSTYVGRCDGQRARDGGDCLTAFHRLCRARGFPTGFGPRQNLDGMASGVCVRP